MPASTGFRYDSPVDDLDPLATMAATTRAIIVHYGEAQLTHRAVASVLSSTLSPRLVVVVDNGPGRYPEPDPSLGERVVVVRPDRNTGFAGGVTIGIETQVLVPPDYLWLLNNDAVAEPHAFAELLAALRRANGRALISSLVEDEATGVIWSDHARYLPWRLESRHRTHLTHSTHDPGDAVVGRAPSWRSVPYLPGCSLLLPTDLLRSIGGLDRSFFMYGEDVDYSLRAVRAGYSLVTARRSIVLHRTSSGTETVARERMIAETGFRLTAKHYRWLLPVALLGALVTGLKRVATRHETWWLTARFRGYRDAILPGPVSARQDRLRDPAR